MVRPKIGVYFLMLIFFIAAEVDCNPARRAPDEDVTEVANNLQAAVEGDEANTLQAPAETDQKESSQEKLSVPNGSSAGEAVGGLGTPNGGAADSKEPVSEPAASDKETKNEHHEETEVPGKNYELPKLEQVLRREVAVFQNCWLDVDIDKHFRLMDELDAKHEQARLEFQTAVNDMNLDKAMLKEILEPEGTRYRAVADRAVHNADGEVSRIPAGINLGGYGMLKLPGSVLFFHRMKLRNDTRFRINYLHNDMYTMTIMGRLSLNDLLLFGDYERATAEHDALFYRPTYGELEILLKDVTYKMEGRLRLVQSRLVVEHVISEMHMKDIVLMYYTNGSSKCQMTEKIQPIQIVEFLERLKADLDMWLKDYFNDYLYDFELSESTATHELHCYEKQKGLLLNDFVDSVIKVMQAKLRAMKPSAISVKIPAFTIYAINGVQIRLHDGVVRGYDSFYRQSIATGRKENKIRMADAVIAFSKLKIEYKYLAKINGRTPPVMGLFSLAADDVIAHLGITMVNDPKAIEISIGYMRNFRPQTLVVEGSVNRMVRNFKHVLEQEIITLMLSALNYYIKQLATISRCEPNIQGAEDWGGADELDDSGDVGSGSVFGFLRNDSVELDIPNEGSRKPNRMHINYQQKLHFKLDQQPKPRKPKENK